jgi:DnaJ-domain-containing protein 1
MHAVSDTARFDDFYLLLGVSPSATEDEIADAYRDRAFLCHPDRLAGASPTVRRRAEQEMRRLNRAWEMLGDPARRAAYDAWYANRYHPPVVIPQTKRTRPAVKAAQGGGRLARPLRYTLAVLLLGAVAGGGFALGRRHQSGGAAEADPTAAVPPLVATRAPADMHLLANSGFEQDAAGWSMESGFEPVPGQGRAASTGLRVRGEGGWNNAVHTVTLPAPGCYQLSVWVKGAGATRIDLLTTDWQPLASFRAGRTLAWTLHGGSFVVDRSGPALLAIRDSEAGPPLLLDDITLVPCPHA